MTEPRPAFDLETFRRKRNALPRIRQGDDFLMNPSERLFVHFNVPTDTALSLIQYAKPKGYSQKGKNLLNRAFLEHAMPIMLANRQAPRCEDETYCEALQSIRRIKQVGQEMANCCANDGHANWYASRISRGASALYFLRTLQGGCWTALVEPRCTPYGWTIYEMKGYGNETLSRSQGLTVERHIRNACKANLYLPRQSRKDLERLGFLDFEDC